MNKEWLEKLTTELVRVPSVSATAGETEVVAKIFDLLAREEYFVRHPEHLRLLPLDNDALGRCNLLALVRGEAADSNATVLVHGHVDTVGADDFGELAPSAFDPAALKEGFRGLDLPPEDKEELLSDDWLCGRGSLDMKSGLTVQLGLLLDWARAPERHRGNLLFLATADEENQNMGIISALQHLALCQREFGLEYVAAVNSDYTSPLYPGDPNRYVYTGTVGKLLPAFYICGRETHVGQCYEGLDPVLLAAEIAREIDLNPELCDEAEGEVPSPPVVLKFSDLKNKYSVQTPGEAFFYCNYLAHAEPVTATLMKLKNAAARAVGRMLDLLETRYKAYAGRAGLPVRQLPWRPEVKTYAELYAEACRCRGQDLKNHLDTLARREVAAGTDPRHIALELVRELVRLSPERKPQVVIFFAPPYCPRNFISPETPAGARVQAALERTLTTVTVETGVIIKRRTFFPGISDSSFLALADDAASLAALQSNFPAWETLYPVPLDAIQRLNIPALNLGPYGKDGHKFTERVYKPYTFEVLPRLLEKTVAALLEDAGGQLTSFPS